MNSFEQGHLALLQKTNTDIARKVMVYVRGSFLAKMEGLLQQRNKKCKITIASMTKHPNAIHYIIRLRHRLTLQYSFTQEGDFYYACISKSCFFFSETTEIYPERGKVRTNI